jgi:hypothetical protein
MIKHYISTAVPQASGNAISILAGMNKYQKT